ncbi:hypothetical protein VTN00DRAFT_4126 [Thermoascus crustaceus]|uniref:uncharacterized protein n=1 Tax=Thermoascus crustaceus TaxID=5088 RepID=UPI003742762C
MSFKAKNLTYERNEPSFLRKLRSQYGGESVRHERPVPRPRKPKDDDDDDAPTYVYEDSNEVISKEDFEALVRGDNQEKPEESAEHAEQKELKSPRDETAQEDKEAEGSKSKQNLAEIGGAKKRKQGKVVGEENTPEENDEARQGGSSSRKPKQKKKKIKLSFDEGEEA